VVDHPSVAELKRLLRGDGSDDGDVSGHIEGCTDCQARLETLGPADSLAAALAQIGGAEGVDVSPHCRQVIDRLEQESERFSATNLASPPEASDEIQLPDVLGNYEVVGKVASGGMGAVYKVRHARLNRVFALKVLRVDRLQRTDAVERFEREWQAAGSVVHPNVVQATDADERDGLRFLVMEYVNGWDISQVVKHVHQVRLNDACELIRQAACGLRAAHEAGLVHRDVKPSNLMLSRDGLVKVVDLGVALLTGVEAPGTDLTVRGQIVGTVEYMSPEQIDHSHTVDQRSDIYALGCTLYYLLTKGPPFSSRKYASVRQILNAHVSETPAALSEHRDDIPPGVEELLARLMAKDSASRPTDMRLVVELLTPWTRGHDLPALVAALTDAETRGNEASSGGATIPVGSTASVRNLNTAETDPVVGDQRLQGRVPGESRLVSLDAGAQMAASQPTRMADITGGRPEKRGKRRVASLAAVLGFTLLASVVIIIKTNDGDQKLIVDGDATIEVDTRQNPVRVNVQTMAGGNPATLEGLPIPGPMTPDNARAQLPLADRLSEFGVIPLPELGEPISPAALVPEPAAIEGVRSWTLETRHHRGVITVGRLSPDGTRLATGGADATIRLWNVADGTLSAILLGHDCSVQSLEWSGDGSAIVSSGGNEVCLWDASRHRLLRRLMTNEAMAARADSVHVVWGPDETEVITFSSDAKLRFWDLKTGAFYKATEILGRWPTTQPLAASDRSERLATCGRGEPVRLWSARTGELLKSWEHESDFPATAISADGTLVAAAGDGQNKQISLWNAEIGDAEQAERRLAHTRYVSSLAFSPDGTRLAAASSREATISVWNVATGRPLPGITTPHLGVTSFAWSDDGQVLVTCGMGTESVAFWDGETGRPLNSISGETTHFLHGIDWHPTQPRLAMGLRRHVDSAPNGLNHGLMIWDLRGGMTGTGNIPNAPNRDPIWDPDGVCVVDNGLLVWDEAQRSTKPVESSVRAGGCDRNLRSWSGDGKHLAIVVPGKAGAPPIVQVRQILNGTLVRELGGSLNVGGIDFAPTGEQIAIAGLDASDGIFKLIVQEVSTGETLRSCEIARQEQKGVASVRWSPDGRTIAIDDIWLTRLFDAESLTAASPSLVHSMGGAAALEDLIWLDGRRLAGTKRGMVRVWELDRGEIRPDKTKESAYLLVDRPSSSVRLSRSPGGDYLAFSGLSTIADLRVSIWDWAKERIAATVILPPGDAEFPIAISAEGHFRSLGADEPGVAELVTVIQTEEGQTTLPITRFAERFGWQNDPTRVPTFER
jgi:WD40 repeat protein/serine/threonine protein kinase